MKEQLSIPFVGSNVTLLDSARTMDADALVKIFDLYSRPLYNYALRLCGDTLRADSIVGDVFAKLLEHLSNGHGPISNLRSYLYEIAYHIVVDEARYSHREVSLDDVDAFQYDNSSLYANLENRLMFERVVMSMRRDLSNDQRHVIVLRFLEGFSLRETASIIGKDVTNVKVIQNRALAKLRSALEYVIV